MGLPPSDVDGCDVASDRAREPDVLEISTVRVRVAPDDIGDDDHTNPASAEPDQEFPRSGEEPHSTPTGKAHRGPRLGHGNGATEALTRQSVRDEVIGLLSHPVGEFVLHQGGDESSCLRYGYDGDEVAKSLGSVEVISGTLGPGVRPEGSTDVDEHGAQGRSHCRDRYGRAGDVMNCGET